jgi:hypothetical protein
MANDTYSLFDTKWFLGFVADTIYVYYDTDLNGFPIQENGEIYLKFVDVGASRIVAKYPIRLVGATSLSRLNVQIESGFIVIRNSVEQNGSYVQNAEVIRYEVL